MQIYEDTLAQVMEAVKASALIALALRSAGLDTQEKTGPLDLVTKADYASQSALESALPFSLNHIDIGFLGEEQLPSGRTLAAQHDWRWCVDPVDGTLPFSKGEHHWSVAVSLQQRPPVPQDRWQTTFAVLYCSDARDTKDALHGKIYWAQKGKGAFVKDVSTNQTRTLKKPERINALAEFDAYPENSKEASYFIAAATRILKDNHLAHEWHRSICYAVMEMLEGNKTIAVQGTAGPCDWDLAFELIAHEAGAHTAITKRDKHDGKTRYSVAAGWDKTLVSAFAKASQDAHTFT